MSKPSSSSRLIATTKLEGGRITKGWTLSDPSVVISGKIIPGQGESSNYNEEKRNSNDMFRLRLGPREREISTSPYLDLTITSQFHGQLLRCWASPVTTRTSESDVSMTSATWKHTSILLSVNCELVMSEECW
ncbi:hypothetical protein ACTXT7_006583 [Hymenolepis weldensis]